MTADAFRRLALSFPEACEREHMAHPDFRVGGKIFATLGYPDACHGMVGLSPEQQRQFVDAHPNVFRPAAGAWGRRGRTVVRLDAVQRTTLRKAMNLAWQKAAAKPSSQSAPDRRAH